MSWLRTDNGRCTTSNVAMLWMIPCDSSQNHSWFTRKFEMMIPFQSTSQGVGWKPKVKFLVSLNFGSDGPLRPFSAPSKARSSSNLQVQGPAGVTFKKASIIHPKEISCCCQPPNLEIRQISSMKASTACVYISAFVRVVTWWIWLFLSKGIERERVSVSRCVCTFPYYIHRVELPSSTVLLPHHLEIDRWSVRSINSLLFWRMVMLRS